MSLTIKYCLLAPCTKDTRKHNISTFSHQASPRSFGLTVQVTFGYHVKLVPKIEFIILLANTALLSFLFKRIKQDSELSLTPSVIPSPSPISCLSLLILPLKHYPSPALHHSDSSGFSPGSLEVLLSALPTGVCLFHQPT